MKNITKLLALLLVLSMLFALAACNKTEPVEDSTAAPTNVETDAPTEAPVAPGGIPDVDLNGFECVLGDWWSPAEYEEKEPVTAWDQLVSDYHHEIESKMNFKFSQIGLQIKGDYNEVINNGLIANDPGCTAFYAKTESVVPLAAQGLLRDLSEMDAFDFENDSKWNKRILDYYTINGKIYAARPAEDEPRLGILFNKRLFEEAGIDPELPYDLQASGQWDWEHFEEICQKLTKDTDNDGKTDVFAMAGNDCDLMIVGIYSNGAMFVERDEDGFFVDGTLNPAFEEGLNWAVSLITKGYCPEIGAGDAWDKSYTDFNNGQVAMICAQTWIISSYLSEMQDDFGYLMLPAGPNGHCCTPMYPTPICIPACIDEASAQNTALALNTWFDTFANIEEAEMLGASFRDTYYSTFRDSRSVDETITAMVTDPECQVYDSYYLIPNYEYYEYLVAVANLSATPAEKIESTRPVNQAAIDATNALFGK